LGKAYTYLRMVRFSSLAILLGLQQVMGQFCGIQSSCSSCVSLVGCVWNLNACWSSSSFTSCIGPSCVSTLGLCPLLSSPVVYPQPLSFSGSVSAVLPPLGTVLPPIYSSSVVGLPYPIVSDASYTAPDFSGGADITLAAPIVSTLPAASVYAGPALSATVGAPIIGAPIIGAPIVSAGFGAPIVANAYVPPVAGGFYAGVNGGADVGGEPLFDANGEPVENTIRNNLYANALSPIIPGIGPAVAAADNVNLVANSPEFVGNVLNGKGYNRNPVGAFVRNGFYANALGGIFGGNVGSSLNAFNKLDLEASLLG